MFARLAIYLAILISVLVPGAASAQKADKLSVSLHAESEAPAPGSRVRIAIKFVPKPGWHGYWSNPGDSGLPPSVRWQAPASVSFGELRHPAPSFLSVAGMASFVHAGTHVLITDARLPSDLQMGTKLPLKAQLNWLACSDSLCVPEKATVDLILTVGEGGRSASKVSLFRSAEASMPASLRTDGQFEYADGKLRLEIPTGAALNSAAVRFYPDESSQVRSATQQPQEQGGVTQIILPSTGDPGRVLSGVVSDGNRSFHLRFLRSSGLQAEAAQPVQATIPASDGLGKFAAEPPGDTQRTRVQEPSNKLAAVQSASPTGLELSFLAAFIGAFLGGLLLNLMPCVLPVLSLKALSLAKSGSSEAAARRDALAYLAGTMVVCLLLGGALLGLRNIGVEVGWAFQLQNPYVVLALLLLVTAISANLMGLFEITGPSFSGMPDKDSGSRGSFATGALSAFIATPCSAPFMASALGAALILPAISALAVFAGLGLGLGLPYVLIAFVPALRNRLPKPGPWMATFRRVLAVPMIITAAALMWVLSRQVSQAGTVTAAMLVLLMVAGVAAIGFQQRRSRTGVWGALYPVTAVGAAVLLFSPLQMQSAVVANAEPLVERFSEPRLAELRRAGTPVFVDFTADWCLACKVNEKIAIDRAETQSAFARAGVVTLIGDWTRGDPAITRFLEAHGRNSIPYYLFYAPGKEPTVLPQILTPGLLAKTAATATRETQLAREATGEPSTNS